MKWHGWIRQSPRGEWRPVCEGESLEQCHRRLVVVAKKMGIVRSRDRFIGAPGRYPPPDKEK